jgi:hypothetical protein
MFKAALILMTVMCASRLLAAATPAVTTSPVEFAVKLTGGEVHVIVNGPDGSPAQKIVLAAADLGDPESLRKTNVKSKFRYAEINKDTRAAIIEIDMELKALKRNILVLLVKRPSEKNAAWAHRGEFVANSSSSGLLASRKETQSLAFGEGGAATYNVHRKTVFDAAHLPSCVCCLPMLSPAKAEEKSLTYAVETIDEEDWQWDEKALALKVKETRRWYVIQPGDNIKTIMEKLQEKGSLLGKIYALNPKIQESGMPAEGERIMVDREIRTK